jgi:hypothetical protein
MYARDTWGYDFQYIFSLHFLFYFILFYFILFYKIKIIFSLKNKDFKPHGQ